MSEEDVNGGLNYLKSWQNLFYQTLPLLLNHSYPASAISDEFLGVPYFKGTTSSMGLHIILSYPDATPVHSYGGPRKDPEPPHNLQTHTLPKLLFHTSTVSPPAAPERAQVKPRQQVV